MSQMGEDRRAAKGNPRYRRALIALFCAGVATFVLLAAGIFLLRCSLCAEHTAAQLEIVLERFAMAGELTGLFAAAA